MRHKIKSVGVVLHCFNPTCYLFIFGCQPISIKRTGFLTSLIFLFIFLVAHV